VKGNVLKGVSEYVMIVTGLPPQGDSVPESMHDAHRRTAEQDQGNVEISTEDEPMAMNTVA
jgi:hypothetical protein